MFKSLVLLDLAKEGIEPRSAALEPDAFATKPKRRWSEEKEVGGGGGWGRGRGTCMEFKGD